MSSVTLHFFLWILGPIKKYDKSANFGRKRFSGRSGDGTLLHCSAALEISAQFAKTTRYNDNTDVNLFQYLTRAAGSSQMR